MAKPNYIISTTSGVDRFRVGDEVFPVGVPLGITKSRVEELVKQFPNNDITYEQTDEDEPTAPSDVPDPPSQPNPEA